MPLGGKLRIAVIGATGLLGVQVVARLLESGHGVATLIRPAGRALPFDHAGLRRVPGDIFDDAALRDVMAGADIALHLATAIPRPGSTMDWSANNRVRREGTQALLAAAAAAGVSRCIAQSIAMLTPGEGDAWLDETAATAGNPVTQSALDLETMIQAASLRWTILRGGAFYGAGTDSSALWVAAAKSGQLTVPGDGTDRVSLIHVTDMARAVVTAAEAHDADGVFNIVDDAPPTWLELFAAIARAHGQPVVATGAPRRFPSFRVSNARARQALGWSPAYPTHLSGMLA